MYISQSIRHPRYPISLSAAKSNNLKFNNLWFDPTDDRTQDLRHRDDHVNDNIPDADNIYFLFQFIFKYSPA